MKTGSPGGPSTPSVAHIRSLREKTGAPVADCRRALQESGGDLAAAQTLLLERGHRIALKKAGRVAGQGRVEAYVHAGGRIGVLLEIHCESDFVARTEEFQKLAHELCLQIAALDPADPKALLEQPHIRDAAGQTKVQDLIAQAIGKLGEKISIARFVRYQVGSGSESAES